tara:strand:+ start:282 stop:458 length:177 start_codon:yes stop_codon:yes gene_type:complete
MDFDIFTVLTNELKLATLADLQTVYNTEDLHEFLEVIEADRELKEIAAIQAKQEAAKE